jgi:hypothetical protein
VFVATGAFIYYNTDVLNPYRNEFEREELRAQYEKLYKPYLAKPQPKVTAAKVAVDIFPHEHRADLKGALRLRNKSGEPVPELYVGVLETAEIRSLAGSVPMKLVDSRRDLGWMRYTLERPLAPGEEMSLDFDLSYAARGFTNAGSDRTVVDNGTFMNSSLLPQLGYVEYAELSDDNERKKHGLAPRERMHDIDDAAARQRNYISNDADWIDLDVVVSTVPDQIALAPGYIQREWTEGNRRYFHYKMDVPILNFYSFLSARYAVKKDVWRDAAGKEVPIEIYYQPGHEYNLDAMISGVKDSLDYFTKNFSPTSTGRCASSSSRATPRSRSPSRTRSLFGIARLHREGRPEGPEGLRLPVLRHRPRGRAPVVGSPGHRGQRAGRDDDVGDARAVLGAHGDEEEVRRREDEALPQVRARQLPPGRGTERKKEQPLFRNENQPYIHYRKGSIAMYALQDAIGEDNVNRALAAYIRKVAYQEPPYTTSRELLAEFRAVTPPEFQYFVADLFETITLWENRAISASYKEKGAGATR